MDHWVVECHHCHPTLYLGQQQYYHQNLAVVFFVQTDPQASLPPQDHYLISALLGLAVVPLAVLAAAAAGVAKRDPWVFSSHHHC